MPIGQAASSLAGSALLAHVKLCLKVKERRDLKSSIAVKLSVPARRRGLFSKGFVSLGKLPRLYSRSSLVNLPDLSLTKRVLSLGWCKHFTGFVFSPLEKREGGWSTGERGVGAGVCAFGFHSEIPGLKLLTGAIRSYSWYWMPSLVGHIVATDSMLSF